MDIWLSAVVVGGLAGGLAVLLWGLCMPRKSCPGCNKALPRARMPSSVRQAMLGGWSCPSCNSRIARDGTLLPDSKHRA